MECDCFIAFRIMGDLSSLRHLDDTFEKKKKKHKKLDFPHGSFLLAHQSEQWIMLEKRQEQLPWLSLWKETIFPFGLKKRRIGSHKLITERNWLEGEIFTFDFLLLK